VDAGTEGVEAAPAPATALTLVVTVTMGTAALSVLEASVLEEGGDDEAPDAFTATTRTEPSVCGRSDRISP
jgi:hypothetical protein